MIRKLIACFLSIFHFVIVSAQNDLEYGKNHFTEEELNQQQHDVDFLRQVAAMDRSVIPDSIVSLLQSLEKDTSLEGQYEKSRMIVRMAYALHGDSDDYTKVVEQLSKCLKDKVIRKAVYLEYYDLCNDDSHYDTLEDGLDVDDLKMLQWTVAYLFGRNRNGAEITQVLAERTMESDPIASYVYFRRAMNWSYNKSFVFDKLGQDIISKKFAPLKQRLEGTKEAMLALTYRMDNSTSAQKIRKSLASIMSKKQSQDIVSAEFLRELGIDYMVRGEYAYAELFLSKSILDYENSYIPDTENRIMYFHTKYLLAKLYYQWGKTKKALELLQRLEEEYGQHAKKNRISYLMIALDLIDLWIEQGQIRTAKEKIDEVEDLMDAHDTFAWDFIPCDIQLSSLKEVRKYLDVRLMLQNTKISQALKLPSALSDIRDVIYSFYSLKKNNMLFSECVFLEQQILIGQKKYTEALQRLESIETQITEGADVETLIRYWLMRARVEKNISNETSKKSILYASDILGSYVKDNIFLYNGENRNFFAEKVHALFSSIEETASLLDMANDSDLKSTLYNNQLISKGLLLTSDNIIKYSVYDTKDASLIEKYNDCTFANSKEVVQSYALPKIQSSTIIDNSSVQMYHSKRNAVNNDLFGKTKTELEIIQNPKVKKNIDSHKATMSISVKDIMQKIQPGEVAIEIASYKTKKEIYSIETDITQYNAYILRKDVPVQRVELFYLRDNDSANNSKMIADLWEKLSPYINDCKTIYISVSGQLQILPFESSSYVIQNNKKVFRLTSTREVALSKNDKKVKTLCAFGGLDYYDASSTENFNRTSEPKTRLSEMRTRGADNFYLQGTKDELDSIASLISNENLKHGKNTYSLTTYEGEYGTEEAFESLSGKKIHVIHIGTHGLYDDGEVSSTSAMDNTALLMSGAYQDDIFKQEDGILTSKEISELDLRGMKLLSLSACDTGLGTISSDGVFGLQRGFKKAGANSILMSLWKVDDAATCKLMTEFYSNWISKKMTKHDALEAAKNTIRKTRGWEDPKYWAAFILLDGLD